MDCDGIAGWIRDLAEKDGPFAGIAHAAGIYSMKPIRAVSAEFVDSMLHVNVTTGIMLGKGLRQKSCHTDNAKLVLVGSTASLSGGGGNVPYAAAKGAVAAATKAMAHELLRDKIRVNCVVPAMIESEMAARTREVVPPESWDAMVAHQPLGMGMPNDVAQAILYLLSDRAHWMTGTTLVLDGGLGVGS
jgi:NAD(P)-dependent dehydrogenase (short-subunit alcohol dehydrogenase family)